VIALALLAGTPGARAGVPVGPRFGVQSLGSFDEPTYVTQPPGRGGVLVVEKKGTVRAVVAGQTLSRPFLNIRSLVTSSGEQGFLSIAFPPDYAQTRRFYAYFDNRNCVDTPDGSACNIEVDEFRRAPDEIIHANLSTRRKVLTIRHHDSPDHSGGQLQFGPGGPLFLATGDGLVEANATDHALDTHSLLGKVLRIDPRSQVRNGHHHAYRIPPSNPYVGGDGRDEIYSIGLRNPWRFSFDLRSGRAPRIVIADVGYALHEEVDYERVGDASGADFGWSRYEGNADFIVQRDAPPPLKFPIFTYDHSGSGGCGAIIGGYVIRNSNLPGMNGRYIYEDFCTSTPSPGQIRSIVPSLGGAADEDDRSEGVTVATPSSFGVDRSNRYYVASLDNNVVYRLVPN
jgi:hypothetical protein